ncbi:MAG: ATP-binding cassette domain-containing protein [Legionella sp.]|nr:ATP-binding cassette domain-containing protein [Legionella sp.]
MVKFYELKKLKWLSIGLVFIKYSLWSVFFILQGKAIGIAIDKKDMYKQLVYTLIGYVSVKIIVMICDIMQKFIGEYYKNIELKRQWSVCFPNKLFMDNKGNNNHIHILFLDYLPKLFDFEATLATNYATIFSVITLAIAGFLHTGFFVGMLALLLVFSLNYVSKNIFIKKIDGYHIEINKQKINILNWVDQYFFSYREISKNWPGIEGSSWRDDVYESYYIAKKNQTLFYLYRDLLSQILVEIPFLLNTSIVIICVYYGYLSLTQLFVWIGFSQFMINASNAYAENKIKKAHCNTLHLQSSDILCGFKSENKTNLAGNKSHPLEITMRDGSKNCLAIEPGIYCIKGANGSGKSTLLNVILGYEREYHLFGNVDCSQLTEIVTQNNIRLIEREAVIFDCLNDFGVQVCGPLHTYGNWMEKISDSTNHLLEPALANEWLGIFKSLEKEYIHRKDKTMSSGEKVILSFMRFLFSWNYNVNLLIIDECDSFLDKEKKYLFTKAINNLSSFMAIYISSHDMFSSASTSTKKSLIDRVVSPT